MRIFFSEYTSNYTTYTFGYAVYAITESKEEIEQVYNRGFLPYSANLVLEDEIFYLCRSLRVRLESFSDSSENKRVNRKMEAYQPNLECIPLSEFDVNSQDFQKFCLDYARERFSGGSMSEDRFRYILNRGNATHILKISEGDKILGYVLLGIHGKAVHYWFAFFDLTISRELPLGKWIMWRSIKWAKEEGKDFVYLGTCYKESALYKVRDHKGVEFFNGEIWSDNKDKLKELCRSDEHEKNSDLYKREI